MAAALSATVNTPSTGPTSLAAGTVAVTVANGASMMFTVATLGELGPQFGTPHIQDKLGSGTRIRPHNTVLMDE